LQKLDKRGFMKLRRFIALDTQRAILMVHRKLGPNALVYSTRRIENGVEVLAGLPINDIESKEVEVEKHNVDKDTIDRLNVQLQLMQESIQKLTNHITTLYQVVSENAKRAQEKEKQKAAKKKGWNFFGRKTQLIEGRYGRHTLYL